MELRVSFDEDSIRRYHDDGMPIFFEVFWQHEHSSYPGEHWTDFGVVVVGWWILEALRLASGQHKTEYLFMDGPFAIYAEKRGANLSITFRGSSERWIVSMAEFIAELISGAQAICNELRRLGIDEERRLHLQVAAERLSAIYKDHT